MGPHSVGDHRCKGTRRERCYGGLHEPRGDAGQEKWCLQVRWGLELEVEEDSCKASVQDCEGACLEAAQGHDQLKPARCVFKGRGGRAHQTQRGSTVSMGKLLD